MSVAEQQIRRAQDLLVTWYRRLHARGLEVADLRANGVSWARIASLYPWDASEWDAAINRLTRTKPYWVEPTKYKEGFTAHSITYPPEITEQAWRDVLYLMSELPLDAPAFDHAGESTHGRYVRIGSGRKVGGGDPYVYFEMTLWLLHVLASSPTASKSLKERRILSRARKVLDQAEALVPILDRPQAEPTKP